MLYLFPGDAKAVQGSVEYVHLGCLRVWLRSRNKLADRHCSPAGWLLSPHAHDMTAFVRHMLDGQHQSHVQAVPCSEPYHVTAAEGDMGTDTYAVKVLRTSAGSCWMSSYKFCGGSERFSYSCPLPCPSTCSQEEVFTLTSSRHPRCQGHRWSSLHELPLAMGPHLFHWLSATGQARTILRVPCHALRALQDTVSRHAGWRGFLNALRLPRGLATRVVEHSCLPGTQDFNHMFVPSALLIGHQRDRR